VSANQAGEKLQTHTYTNELHDTLIDKDNRTFWKCWKSKFGSDKKNCEQVDGCVDPVAIAGNFAKHFSDAFTCNDINRMKVLEDEYNFLYRCSAVNKRCIYLGLKVELVCT